MFQLIAPKSQQYSFPGSYGSQNLGLKTWKLNAKHWLKLAGSMGLKWRFPEIGLPLVIIHFRLGFSMKETIYFGGVPMVFLCFSCGFPMVFLGLGYPRVKSWKGNKPISSGPCSSCPRPDVSRFARFGRPGLVDIQKAIENGHWVRWSTHQKRWSSIVMLTFTRE